MPISTDQYSIKHLFDQKQTFTVPKYQRGYAWEEDALVDFIGDLSKCLDSRLDEKSKPHFFGGVVTIRRAVIGSTRENYEIVDGQQRLASFVILIGCVLSHLSGALKEIGTLQLDKEEEKARHYFEETSEKLQLLYLVFRDNKGIEYRDVPKLKLSKADNVFFQSIIDGQKDMEPERESHQRIRAARDRLNNFVKSKFFPAGLGAADVAIQLQIFLDEVLGKDCTAIFMCSHDRSEAYQIFQVLNDRGVNLGQGDLLRARTLELLDGDKHVQMQDEVAEQWDHILSYAPREIQNYLMWYFSSMEGRRPKLNKLSDEFLEHRFGCKDEQVLETSDAERLLGETKTISNNFTTLAAMDDGDWPCDYHEKVGSWDRERLRMLVSDLQHTNAMPLLLSLALLDPPRFAKAVAMIERFVFRYKTIANAHTTPMTTVYLKHAKAIRNAGTYALKALRTDLATLIQDRASDSIFETALRESKFSPKGNNRYLRYFFLTIEDYTKWCESGAQGVPKCKDKSRVFDIGMTSIEHIYPQKPTEGEVNDDLESVKHNIGNLTVLAPSDNNSLSNATFDKKRSAFAKSSLNLNRTIAMNKDWSKFLAQQRESTLMGMALKIFVP